MKKFKIRCSQIGNIMGKKGLGQTGLNYLDIWAKEQLYSRKKEFTSKYTIKGNINEDESIDFVSDFLNLGFIVKNEKHFENDYLTGTPDVILPNLLIDVKNSWDCFTFPFFADKIPNDDYFYQAQGYMELTGINKFKLIYTLTDTPFYLIEHEFKRYCYTNGYELEDTDLLEKFVEKMTYKDIPIEKKIKIFDIEKDTNCINLIKSRVEECQQIINEKYSI